MAVTFVLGRAGAGKTRHCLDALAARLAARSDTQPLILIVPEQASLQMERALAARSPGGGYWRAQVLSFSRLAQRVLDQSDASTAALGAGGRAMVLRNLRGLKRDGQTGLVGACDANGLYPQLGRVVETLLRENVTPPALRETAARLDGAAARRKTHDLADLLERYLDWLRNRRLDPALQLKLVRARLERVAWLTDASVWVDGFASFGGQELLTLVALSRTARDVTITLMLDPASATLRQRHPDPLELFAATVKTYQRLRTLLTEAGVALNPEVALTPAPMPRFTPAPALAQLEAGLAAPWADEGEPRPSGEADAVRIMECDTHRDELRHAAHFIRAQVAASGGALRFADFAVIARDVERIADAAAAAFGEYGIPYFLDRRRAMGPHALARLVESLFEVVAGDFPVEAVTRLLQTDLLPLKRAEAAALENLVVAEGLRGAAVWRLEDWESQVHTRSRAARRGPRAAQRLRLYVALSPLLQLDAAGGARGQDWAEALLAVLRRLRVRNRMGAWVRRARQQGEWETAEVHRLAWETCCQVLDDLHDLLGETRLATGEAAAVVGTALREATLGIAPPTIDQVLVSGIERSRHPDVKYVWIVAFNEGVFPAPPGDDELFSTSERSALNAAGLTALAPRRDDAFAERLLAYVACTRASRGLTISYAAIGSDGDSIQPSPLLADVQRVLPGVVVQCPDESAPPVCAAELARQVLASRGPPRGRLAQLVRRVRDRGVLATELADLLRGRAYENAPVPVAPAGAPPVASLSQIDTFLHCPFKHFARHRLRIEADRGPGPSYRELGTAAHDVLDRVIASAMGEPGGVRAIDSDRWAQLVAAAVAAYRGTLPAGMVACRPQAAFQHDLLGRFMLDVVSVHAERWKCGGFEPALVEQRFGHGDGALPALEISCDDGRRLAISGKIDRVDICRDGDRPLLALYDYKRSIKPVKVDLMLGNALQLFTYLLAMETGGEVLAAGDAAPQPAAAFLAPVRPDLDVTDKKYFDSAAPEEQQMFLYQPRGRMSEDAARRLDPRRPGRSPVASIQVRKDGSFAATCDVVSAEGFEQIAELARLTLRTAAVGLTTGVLEVAPLLHGKNLACRNCEFRPLCRFDRTLNEPRVAETVLPRLEDGRIVLPEAES